MRSIIFSIFIFLFSFECKAQTLSIIPQPLSIEQQERAFTFSPQVKIVSDKDEFENANYLNTYLAKYYQVRPLMQSNIKKYIALRLLNSKQKSYSLDEYTLMVTTDSIVITGTDAGIFYGIQTLLQLMPAEMKMQFDIPCVAIHDYPRFSWRGMHLDCSRHFFSVEFVKKYIDMMAYYKMNTFHWHLTDDQGWRIEIKQYPKLTSIGSYRKETMVEKNFTPYIGDKTPYDGFYTQEQIKEIVKYAAQRHVTIVPEIEMPGHSQAAIAAYPELACFGMSYDVLTKWGGSDVVLCPIPEVIQFYENILDEVMALFPGEYIHVGGDEVPDAHWKQSKQVTELMLKENIKTYPGVEAYFINTIEKYINSKGRKMIGWDEILDGGVSANASIMSWRGTEGGIAAAKHGNYAVMTPGDYCYFDHCQSKNSMEPLCIGGFLPLEKVYSYEPVSSELTPEQSKYILGAQANVWTEYLSTPEQIEYMIFPRMIALSEVVWSAKTKKDWWDFVGRLQYHFTLLEFRGINYRVPEPEIQLRPLAENKFTLGITSLKQNSDFYYTTDGTNPTSSSLKYSEAIEITLTPLQKVKAIAITKSGKKSIVIERSK
ncbi:beta-N-acetylhexosaminidase [Bacteroidota bacterium]|nr:beta-N-acetylhexosaminidase [Bacteroidota bacterium]